MALTRIIVQTPSGFVAQNLGWPTYFIISIVISIPGLLLLLRYDKWQQVNEEHHAAVSAN
jgi:PAT family beta-lactamase induction signal transducer AmpG